MCVVLLMTVVEVPCQKINLLQRFYFKWHRIESSCFEEEVYLQEFLLLDKVDGSVFVMDAHES
jgi:hypothetical protein